MASKASKFIEDYGLQILLVGVAGVGVYLGVEEVKEAVDSLFGGQVTDNPPNTANVTKPKEVYQSAADSTYSDFTENILFTSNIDKLLSYIEGFNDDELKQVYNDFGTRRDHISILPIGLDLHDLIWFYTTNLSDTDLPTMKSRWAGTGLWP